MVGIFKCITNKAVHFKDEQNNLWLKALPIYCRYLKVCLTPSRWVIKNCDRIVRLAWYKIYRETYLDFSCYSCLFLLTCGFIYLACTGRSIMGTTWNYMALCNLPRNSSNSYILKLDFQKCLILTKYEYLKKIWPWQITHFVVWI